MLLQKVPAATRSTLEDFASMIGKKMRMRSKIDSLRTTRTSTGVNEAANRFRDSVASDKDRQIVIDRYQSPIEHPVHCATQRYAVSDRIGPAIGNRLDVSGLNLSAATTIDDLESGNGAGLSISLLHSDRERDITERSSDQPFDNGALKS